MKISSLNQEYLSSRAGQPSALVLSFTLSPNLLGRPTEADCQVARRWRWSKTAGDSFIVHKLLSLQVVELPASDGWLVGLTSYLCLQTSSISPLLFNHPLLSTPDEDHCGWMFSSPYLYNRVTFFFSSIPCEWACLYTGNPFRSSPTMSSNLPMAQLPT